MKVEKIKIDLLGEAFEIEAEVLGTAYTYGQGMDRYDHVYRYKGSIYIKTEIPYEVPVNLELKQEDSDDLAQFLCNGNVAKIIAENLIQ